MGVFLLYKILTQAPKLLPVGGKYAHCLKRDSRIIHCRFVKRWPNGLNNYYALHPITQALSGRLKMDSRQRTPRSREFPLSILPPVIWERPKPIWIGLEWNCGDCGVSLLEFGDVCEQRDWKQPCGWSYPGGWGVSVWRGDSKCLTFPASQEVCLEGSCESSWKTFPGTKTACRASCVAPQQKEALGELQGQELRGGGERWAKAPHCLHLNSCNWPLFYRPGDHRPVDRLLCFLFFTLASCHSLIPALSILAAHWMELVLI